MYIPNQCDLHTCKKVNMCMVFRNFEPFEEHWKWLHQHNLLHGTLDMHNYTVVPNTICLQYISCICPSLLQVIADQLKLEREREAELDLLYQ